MTHDETKSNRIINFIERVCTHVKGDLAGQPFLLEDWQKEFIHKMFGTIKQKRAEAIPNILCSDSAKELENQIYPRAIALAILFVEKEQGAEIYCCASSRDQAKIVFEVCKQMVRNSAILTKNCKTYQNSIVLNGTNSFLKAVAADAGLLHGANASAVIYA